MISIKNIYKPKSKPMGNKYLKNQYENNIEILKRALEQADIYGCDIKVRSKGKESDWITINDEQMEKLIDSYKEKLKSL